MSTDTKWIVGTGVAIIVSVVGTGVALGTLLLVQVNGVNARIDDLRADLTGQIDGTNTRIQDLRTNLVGQISELRTDMRGLDARMRAVEVSFGKIDQRLLTIERVLLPSSTAGD